MRGALAIIATVCVLIYFVGGLILDSHINSAIGPLRNDTRVVEAAFGGWEPFAAPVVLKKGTSRNLERFEEFEKSLTDINKEIQGTLLFFAVAYICAKYAVRIEHPFRWYLAARMKNYKQSPTTDD